VGNLIERCIAADHEVLTPDEVNLLWDTAPPRMPIPGSRPGDGTQMARFMYRIARVDETKALAAQQHTSPAAIDVLAVQKQLAAH
jgi:hypothetical protein